jgi:WD40 repeat protein
VNGFSWKIACCTVFLSIKNTVSDGSICTAITKRWFVRMVAAMVFGPSLVFVLAQERATITFLPRFLLERLTTSAFESTNLVAFSPDGKTLLTEGLRSMAWDVSSGRRRWSLPGTQMDTNAVAFSPDGSLVATDRSAMTYPHFIGLYNTKTGRKIVTFKVKYAAFVEGIAWSPDRRWIAVSFGSSEGGSVRLYRAGSGLFERDVTPICRYVASIGWRPGKNELALGCQDGTLEVYQVEGQEALFSSERLVVGVTLRWLFSPPDRQNRFVKIAWNPDGSQIALGWNDRVTLLDAISGLPTLEFLVAPDRCCCAFDGLAWSPDGSVIATTTLSTPVVHKPDGHDQTDPVRLFDARTGDLLHEFDPRNYHGNVVFSPDGTMLVTAGTSSVEGFVNVWGSSDGSSVFMAERLR